MLHTITSLDHYIMTYIKDDPVRPELSREFRVQPGRFISAHIEGSQPRAIVCVSLHDRIPTTVEELHAVATQPTVAIFYTIWSYSPGAGRALLLDTVNDIRSRIPGITRFVTLSPKTEMAKRFHLKNGAFVLQENSETVNYEYLISVG